MEYCEKNNLNPRIDASNYERIYSRNKVRLDILPYMRENFNKDIVDTLNRMTLLLQKDNEFIEEYSKKCYNVYCKNHDGKLKISKGLFEKEMESIVTRVIIRAFKEISNSHQNFEMKHIYEIVNLAHKETGKKLNLTNKILCENLYGDIIFINEEKQKDNDCSYCEIKINKSNISDKVIFNDYIIKFEIIENKNKGEFPKNSLIKLFDYDNTVDKYIEFFSSHIDKSNYKLSKEEEELYYFVLDKKFKTTKNNTPKGIVYKICRMVPKGFRIKIKLFVEKIYRFTNER